ncbi:sec1 family domain-containing protein 2-like isoform X2 [Mercenaria mercenaria]|nr:sec1 family domain-containing protein 2-like isoform X2 [Mercenaria mercenaria]XP_053380995.1 sec1 family domain-containing protein 2-like isoform X2 [Mercenaria mercenaria]
MANLKTITASQHRHLETICSHANRAVVFIDTISAELLHWQGGLLKLINAGATDVKEFSSFESGSEDQKKGVFIVSSLLEGVTRQILQDIIQESNFQYVVVITSESAAVHIFSRSGVVEEDSHFFDQVEERLLEWMGNMNFTAEVFHIPFCSVSLGNSVFLTPGYTKLFPLVGSDLHQIELQYNSKHGKSEMKDFGSLKDVDFASLPKDLQMFYKCFVSSVDSLLTDLGVKEDIYSVGYTSAILATELEAYPPAKTRRKALTDRASVVFIDRTLDLGSVTSHNTECLLDRIQQVLPRLPGHMIDVKVNMSPLCKVHRESGGDTISPGCLATQSGSQSHLQTLITGKNKEALMEVNRQLIEAASACGLPISLTGKPTRISAEQLNSTLTLFRGRYKEISKHLDWLQVSMATYQTLSNPTMHHCDDMISVEKGLLQSLADPDGPGALSQALQMLQRKTEDKWTYSVDDMLCILVYVYSLGGTSLLSQIDEETALQEMLLDRIFEEKSELPPLIRSIVGEVITDRSIVSDILEDLWEKLSAIAVSREHLSQFKSVIDPGSAVSPASQNSLLKQLVAAILDPDKQELVDIEFKSSGLRDKLKSGFGLFRGVSKPRPSDHPLMILFVIGGVNCTEVKQIKDLVNQYKPGTQVVVGSTRLLTPHETVKSLLCQNNINPLEVT